MAFDPDEQWSIVPIVAELSAAMMATFKRWSDPDWNRDSYCAGWTRADVVAHVTTGTAYRTEVLKLGLADNPIFPWGASSLEDVQRIRAQMVATLCDSGPEALLNGFTRAVHQHQEVLISIQHSTIAKVARYPRGFVPVGEWIGMQLIELAVHDWDMRQPDDPSARLNPLAVEPVLKVLPETQMRFLSHRLDQTSAPPLKDGGYQFCAGETDWIFRVQSQSVAYETAAPASVTTRFHTDPETLILLTLGRLDMASQLAVGACRFEGYPTIDTSVYELIFGPYLSASVIEPNEP